MATRLTFLGTRAYVDASSGRHRRHSALALDGPGGRVMVDCGADWRGHLGEVGPDAILLTHAHPDHAFGLKDGAPCPVWATEETWADLRRHPVEAGGTVRPRTPVALCGLSFEAFPVAHSTRCPTVAYRIVPAYDEGAPVLYAPDVVYIEDRSAALDGCALYIGDGTSLTRSLVRTAGRSLVGHAPVRQQLTWCQKAGVPAALFTHNGRHTIAEPDAAAAELEGLAQARGVTAGIAADRDVHPWPGASASDQATAGTCSTASSRS
jgi:phosphoribosyl 1,2-cyclic phosphodiesterase